APPSRSQTLSPSVRGHWHPSCQTCRCQTARQNRLCGLVRSLPLHCCSLAVWPRYLDSRSGCSPACLGLLSANGPVKITCYSLSGPPMSVLPPKADITREDASLEKKVAHVSWLPS